MNKMETDREEWRDGRYGLTAPEVRAYEDGWQAGADSHSLPAYRRMHNRIKSADELQEENVARPRT